MMKLFGYGSLMNEASLHQSFPGGQILGTGTLIGYRRIFDFKSPYRKNPETNVYSSVLNIAEDPTEAVTGVILQIPEESYQLLSEREAGYDEITVELENGEKVSTFVALRHQPYSYIFNDPVQAEYLELCVEAAAKYGFLANFLGSTFIENDSLAALKERGIL